MPTARTERRAATRRGATGPTVVLAATVLLVAGCSPVQEAAPGPGSEAARPSATPSLAVPSPDLEPEPPVVEGLAVPPNLEEAFSALLDARARAVRDGDRDAFLAGLDPTDPGFLVAQAGYFDNLAQLPVGDFAYAVDPSSLVRGTDGYSVVVEITLRLEGFDAVASTTLDRFRFDRADPRPGSRGGQGRTDRYLLASVTDRAWEDAHDIQAQPWESRPIQVRRAPGVLAVFDDASVREAGPVVRGIEQSVADVSARMPYPWDPSVVVYALSDTTFIRSLDDLPGDEPDALDGISFTVPAGPGDPRVASTRIALNPRTLATSAAERDRLLRHELTHVALGSLDDHAPLWLSEGLAEWVSVQALPQPRRQIDQQALAALRRGVTQMPDDATFNDDDAAVHYALAWWVCEYLASVYGPTAPWSVLDAFGAPGTPEGPTIQALLRIGPAALAKRGARLAVETYAPRERERRGRNSLTR